MNNYVAKHSRINKSKVFRDRRKIVNVGIINIKEESMFKREEDWF